jgi:hypothetical protein
MKMVLTFLLFSVAVASHAQNITAVTTLIVPGITTNSVGEAVQAPATNSVTIPNGEAVLVATIIAPFDACWFEKRGSVFEARRGDVVCGPVTFYLSNPGGPDTLLSLSRWKVKKEGSPK